MTTETIKITSIAYLSAGDESPWQHKSSFGIEDISHNPYEGEDEDALVQEISADIKASGGSGIEDYWLRDETLYVKTEDVCRQEREQEEEEERLARELEEE